MLTAPGTPAFSTATVGLMQEGDLPAVLDIERQSNSHPWTERNFLDALASGYLCLTAVERQRICGFAVARLLPTRPSSCSSPSRPMAAVRRRRIAVERTGAAPLCWRRPHRASRSAGLNYGAQAFYSSRGFVQSGLRRQYYPGGLRHGEREDAWLMQVPLALPAPVTSRRHDEAEAA